MRTKCHILAHRSRWQVQFLKGPLLDLQGQLEPSGLLAAVLPSGQQPNALLSQDALSSAVGNVVLRTAKPRGGERISDENLTNVKHSAATFKTEQWFSFSFASAKYLRRAAPLTMTGCLRCSFQGKTHPTLVLASRSQCLWLSRNNKKHLKEAGASWFGGRWDSNSVGPNDGAAKTAVVSV